MATEENTKTAGYITRNKLGWGRWLLFLIGKPVKTRVSVLHTTPWLTRGMIAFISLISIMAWFSAPDSFWVTTLQFHPETMGVGLVGCAFIHGGWAHLGGNMYFLWLFGRHVECRFGRRRMVGLFLIATALGAYFHGLVSDAPLIGASGGVFGILILYGMLFPKTRIMWVPFFGFMARFIALRAEKMLGKRFLREGLPVRFFLLIYVLIQFVLLYQQIYLEGNISAMAHLGGGLAGLVIYYGWKQKVLP